MKEVWILGKGETEAIERGEAVACGQEMTSSTEEKNEELWFLDFGAVIAVCGILLECILGQSLHAAIQD
ncbi:hypothetical protein TSUD_159610 [Trifolium subterraneum]|uniref:Uncharacterized protein n=1 Tax=Trifolium subterraneum TaxID=3900 RepID=A0A2Z6NAG4_TRISU|nr:hypothetical protein TSUD_159610 [Trifolium subterraneum]